MLYQPTKSRSEHLTHPGPVELFKLDQQTARNQKDPYSSLCVISTISKEKQPQSRTLVLREVEGSLAIFINKSSPKWEELNNGVALQTYWASTQIQYRMSVSTKPIDKEIINQSWQLRPEIPKKMDWIYENGFPQSSEVTSLDQIRTETGKITEIENLTATENATGLILTPQKIERLSLDTPDGIHDRKLFIHTKERWSESQLMP